MKRINENAGFLSLMEKHGKNPANRKKLIEVADKGEIDACCELYLNPLKGNITLTPKLAKTLTKFKKPCLKLLDSKVGLSKKKKILASQTGGFLPFLVRALLPMSVPLVKSVIGAFKGKKKS